MNKLRTLSLGGGGSVVLLAIWASVRYGGSSGQFVEAIALGVLAAGLPWGLARLKAWLRWLRYRLGDEDIGFSEERGSIFVSESTVSDPVDCLEAVRAAVREEGGFEAVERDEFDGSPALNVVSSGFHSSLVRVAESGHVVVTGVSERTEALAETVGRACSMAFERTRNNPFVRTQPVRGGPRVFLGIIVFAVLLAGVNAVGAGAYPDSPYNAAERTVLVGIDARADVDPGVSPADSKLHKAAFTVAILDEASTEIRWVGNDTGRIADFGRRAVAVSEDARGLLADVRTGGPTPAQADRADRIEADLRDAERSAARALEARAEQEELEATEELRRLADRLRSAGDGSTRTTDRLPSVRPGPVFPRTASYR